MTELQAPVALQRKPSPVKTTILSVCRIGIAAVFPLIPSPGPNMPATPTKFKVVSNERVRDDQRRSAEYFERMNQAASTPNPIGATISVAHLATAIRSAAKMGLREKEAVCDRVYAAQPNLLGSVLAVRSFGVDMATIDVLLDILIVLQLAVEESGQVLATVTEADQERELSRFTASVRFAEGLSRKAFAQSFKQTTAYKREPFLLAHVVDVLKRSGIAGFRDEASKYSFLAAMNLVNCVATAKRVGGDARQPR